MITYVLSTISSACIQISAILIAFGWYAIRKGNKERHQKLMVTASCFALTFFIIYMSRTIFIGNVSFGGPKEWQLPYTIFLVFHIILATTGGIMGVISITLAIKKKFALHRKISPYTAVIWFGTAVTGIVVYVLLIVLWPGEMEISMLKAIFGT
ncbi:putative membrane protein [Scopulibacillus darangshiensis]|uniref:Putative membrane protein n=1 Tax=Scopulibacillus darangshiensis TaxID=442528 RepID=A0A4V2SNA4_9BACL|nr:DUF420 domain-containing protein [Scopulibacillus darangshiensis]TCP30496.1 putative membrane protein [Scopulibacillus darangshiensis]